MGLIARLFTAGRTSRDAGGTGQRPATRPVDDQPAHKQPLRTILVASGDWHERQTWSEYVAHPQHRILVAEDGHAAFQAIQANKPDLLVAAFSMARMDGLELLRAVQTSAPQLRVMLIARGNSHVDRTYMKLAKLLGAVATFTQPLDGPTLLSGVRTALDLDRSTA